MLAHPRRRGKGRKARQEHVPSAWELVALVISIVSLLAILLIASTGHGQPATTLRLSKWIWFHRQHQRLSDVELYDQASRGPWGALVMLWRVRWKDFSSLAAIVIVSSLAIEPFAQQLAHIRLERVVAYNLAIANVQWIVSSKIGFWGIQDTFISAFFTSAALETFSDCPSGNCSWSPYQSLVACDLCVDISEQIQINDSCFYAINATGAAYLSNGLIVEFKLSTYQSQEAMMNTNGTGALLKIENGGLSLLNFTKITIDYGSSSSHESFGFECFNGTYQDQSDVPRCVQRLRTVLPASECTLYWCINRYSARQESGTFHENYIDSWRSQYGLEIDTLPGDNTSEYFRMIPVTEDGKPPVLEQNLDRSNAIYTYSLSSNQVLTSYEPCYVERVIHGMLSRSLARVFTTNLTSTRGAVVPYEKDFDTLSRGVVLYGLKGVFRGDDAPMKDAVYRIFSDVAYGLTQYIRHDQQNPPVVYYGEGKFHAIGTTFEDRTVVRVRWGWLAFPVGLVAMTGLLTVATRFRSSRQHIPAWGSSTVALILRGPWSHAPEMLPSINSTKRMQRRAKRTEVALQRTAHGDWRLSGQNLSTG